MQPELLILLIEGPVVLMAGYLWYQLRQIMRKIDHLDERTDSYMTEAEIRVLIQDKLEPVKQRAYLVEDRLDRLEHKIDQVLERLSDR
jgi:tetrahydromethanopterin S-methyltransferase subunit G